MEKLIVFKNDYIIKQLIINTKMSKCSVCKVKIPNKDSKNKHIACNKNMCDTCCQHKSHHREDAEKAKEKYEEMLKTMQPPRCLKCKVRMTVTDADTGFVCPKCKKPESIFLIHNGVIYEFS